MDDLELTWRKFELLRMRWNLENDLVTCDPEVLPAALDWLDGEIAYIVEIENARLAGRTLRLKIHLENLLTSILYEDVTKRKIAIV